MSKFFEAVKINIPVFKDVVIDPKIILYVMECSRINPRFDIPAYKKFRESLLRQTYNEEITLIAKQVLSKKN
jgi:hypothetical protein